MVESIRNMPGSGVGLGILVAALILLAFAAPFSMVLSAPALVVASLKVRRRAAEVDPATEAVAAIALIAGGAMVVIGVLATIAALQNQGP